MALHLDVVCHDWRVSADDRRQQTVRVIGEILPLVLAKYGAAQDAAAALHAGAARSTQPINPTARFRAR